MLFKSGACTFGPKTIIFVKMLMSFIRKKNYVLKENNDFNLLSALTAKKLKKLEYLLSAQDCNLYSMVGVRNKQNY